MKISAQCSALGFSNSSFQDFDEIDYTCWTQNPALHTQVCHCPQFLLYPPGKLADSLPLQRPPVLEKTSTNLEGAGRGAWPLRAQPCGTCSSRRGTGSPVLLRAASRGAGRGAGPGCGWRWVQGACRKVGPSSLFGGVAVAEELRLVPVPSRVREARVGIEV